MFDAIGIVLVAAAIAALGLGAVLSTVAGAQAEAGHYDAAQTLRGATVMLSAALPGILLLFGMCGLIPGEQLRRGWIGRNPTPPATALPSATNVSSFRVLGAGWHAFWVVVAFAISLTLLVVPMVGWFTGGWPVSLAENDFSGFWTIYGSIGFGVATAALVSLIKKLGYWRAQARGLTRDIPEKGRGFWRFVTYRWRFDLWIAGLGGVVVALSPMFLADDVGPDGDRSLLPPEIAGFVVMAAVGVVLVVLGILASLRYWRSGETLGSGESAS